MDMDTEGEVAQGSYTVVAEKPIMTTTTTITATRADYLPQGART